MMQDDVLGAPHAARAGALHHLSDAVRVPLIPPTHAPAQAFEQPGLGRVLVVDGGGSQRCALLGDNIAEMAHKNGWSVRAARTARLPGSS